MWGSGSYRFYGELELNMKNTCSIEREKTRPPASAQHIQSIKFTNFCRLLQTSFEFSSWVGYLSLCVAIFAVYLATLSDGVAGGDSGELLAEACHLGTAHPPGYPLFTILYHVAMKYPALDRWSPAYRANAFTSLISACSSGILASCIEKLSNFNSHLTRFSITSSSVAIAFAFSPLIWQYSVTSEVFALNNFFAALLIYQTLLFMKNPTWLYARYGAFSCGLALTNQHTIILFIVPLAMWVLFVCLLNSKKKKESTWYIFINIGLIFVCCLAGLTPYLLLMLTARHFPKPGSWGEVRTLQGLLHHFIRGDYGSMRLYSGNSSHISWKEFWSKIQLWATNLNERQGLYVVPTLALFGYFCLVQKGRYEKRKIQEQALAIETLNKDQESDSERSRSDGDSSRDQMGSELSLSVTHSIALALAVYIIVFHALSNLPLDDPLYVGVQARFWQQPNLVVFLFAGIGLKKIHQNFPFFGYLISLFLVIGQILRSLKGGSSQKDAVYFSQYAKAVLKPLPKNTILLINNDQVWTSTRYMNICEEFRSDVTLLNMSMMTFRWWSSKHELYPKIDFPGSHYGSTGFSLYSFIKANLRSTKKGSKRGMPIFIEGKPNFIETKLEETYDFMPIGLSHRVIQKNSNFKLKEYIEVSKKSWKIVDTYLPIFGPKEGSPAGLPSLLKYTEETWERTLWTILFDHLSESGSYLLEKSIISERADERESIQPMIQAAAWLEASIHWDLSRKPPSHVLKNIGLAYMHLIRNKSVPSMNTSLPKCDCPLHSCKLLPWTTSQRSSNWKNEATTRFLNSWRLFLEHDNSKFDAQYETVRSIYDTVTNSISKHI